jgi:peptidoglycan hydrolase-like protein with peptidoglycan-binding domain
MSAIEPAVRGTRVHHPGPDWNHLRETVLMMELAVAQVEAAMTDSSASVDALTGTFTTMANTIRLMEDRIGALADDDATRDTRQQLLGAAGHVGGMVRQAIIAFQFYDRLSQRLSHVSNGLAWLAELVSDPQQVAQIDSWRDLQQRIRARYSMPEENEMFEAVLLRGLPVDAAVREFMEKLQRKGDDIELF